MFNDIVLNTSLAAVTSMIGLACLRIQTVNLLSLQRALKACNGFVWFRSGHIGGAVVNTVMNIPGSLMREILWSPELLLSGKN
jgi:hypothetical protein